MTRKTGLGSFAPKRKEPIPVPEQPASAAAAVGLPIGPRGGKPAKRVDRAVSMSFRMSASQYRKLCEARLDENTTTQTLVLSALEMYFQTKHVTPFV